MSNIMAVLQNGIAQIEYNRDKFLPDHQQLYLDKMDEKMNTGILIDNVLIENPEPEQRLRFVAGNLANAIKSGDEPMVAALCAYLASRQPELKQVKIEDVEGGISIDLVYDEVYLNQIGVQFNALH
ncbi:MAG: hypothetical protein OEY89_09155 [Gammaproteobacteria bacterium]|nr:hypothetical protein [Gammaproteobacteria bacterium]